MAIVFIRRCECRASVNGVGQRSKTSVANLRSASVQFRPYPTEWDASFGRSSIRRRNTDVNGFKSHC